MNIFIFLGDSLFVRIEITLHFQYFFRFVLSFFGNSCGFHMSIQQPKYIVYFIINVNQGIERPINIQSSQRTSFLCFLPYRWATKTTSTSPIISLDRDAMERMDDWLLHLVRIVCVVWVCMWKSLHFLILFLDWDLVRIDGDTSNTSCFRTRGRFRSVIDWIIFKKRRIEMDLSIPSKKLWTATPRSGLTTTIRSIVLSTSMVANGSTFKSSFS